MLASHLGCADASAFAISSTLLGIEVQSVATQVVSSRTSTALLDAAAALPGTLSTSLNLPIGAVQVIQPPQAILPPAPPPPPPISPAVSPSPSTGQPAAGPSAVSPAPAPPSAADEASDSTIPPATESSLQGNDGSGMSTEIIVVAAGAGLLIVILLMIFLYKRRKRLANSRMLDAIKVQVSSKEPADGSKMIADFLQSDLSPDIDPDKSTPTSSLRHSHSSGTLTSTGQAALERARSHRQSKSSVRRTNSWGRLGVRRTPSFKRDHQESESGTGSPPPRQPALELADGLETQLAALEQKKSPPSSPKLASNAGPGSMHTMPSEPRATVMPGRIVAAVAAVATQSESISNPSDSRGGTPPLEAAPASEPLPSAPVSAPTDVLLAGGKRQLRLSSSGPEDPLSTRSPVTRTPTAATHDHVGAARADASDQSGTSGSGSGKASSERSTSERKRIRQLLVAGPPTVEPTEQGSGSNVRLPRRSLKQSWPPESSPAARSGISSSSLEVDRV